MKNKISVIIHTYNAEKFLVEVLEAVKNFDEILVCDMESTDSTIEISKTYGARIITFPRGEYNIAEHARQTAIEAATYEWVFTVDADEIVPTKLREYLYNLINKEGGADADAYYIPRRNYFLARFMRSHYPDYIIRFFRRDKAYWPPVVHSNPEINGKVSHIPAKKELSLEHLANDSIGVILEKTNRYTDNELQKKGIHKYGLLSLLYRPFWRFFKLYIMKGAILDGKAGLIKSLLEANYQFSLIMKMIEAQILYKTKKKIKNMKKTRILFLVSRLLVGGIDTLLKNYLAKYDREHYEIELAVGIYLKDLESIRKELPQDLKIHYLIDEDILTHFKIKKIKNGLNVAEKIIDEALLNTFRRLKSIYKLKKLSQNFDAIIDFDTHFHYILKDIDKPKIAFYHFSIRQEKESRQRRLGEKFAIYNKVVCICNEMREQAIGLYPKLKDKFHSIYNALDFTDIVDKASQIPADLPKGRYILAVQRLEESQKDARTLINAFSLVAKNPIADEFKLYIIGDGDDRSSLQNIINNLGLEKRIFLLGYRANPYPYIANADIFVLSSKMEGFGISLIEAMILDRSLISSQCETGPGELLDYGKGGRLVPVSDSTAMADAIIDCIVDENKNAKLREYSREFVLRFDVNLILKEIYKLVEKTIKDYNAEDK